MDLLHVLLIVFFLIVSSRENTHELLRSFCFHAIAFNLVALIIRFYIDYLISGYHL